MSKYISRPKPVVQVVKGVAKEDLVALVMKNYTGTTAGLQQRQYQRMSKVKLALLVQQRAYFTQRGM